jgi:phage gpG-like protein
MIEVTATVVGAAEVQAKFAGAAEKARPLLRSRVQRLGLELLRKVKAEKLSGQVLHVQTGRLRGSVNEQTTDEGAAIVSSVGTNVVYGAAWELGFDRAIGPGSRGGVRNPVRHSKAAAAAGTRHYGPRAFLGPSLAEMRDRVFAQLSAAAGEVVR